METGPLHTPALRALLQPALFGDTCSRSAGGETKAGVARGRGGRRSPLGPPRPPEAPPPSPPPPPLRPAARSPLPPRGAERGAAVGAHGRARGAGPAAPP